MASPTGDVPPQPHSSDVPTADFSGNPNPAFITVESRAPGESIGDTIDHYKLLQPLGEGGMGKVWLAEQRAPLERRVALKIIKPGMDSDQVIARFEQERQALALMDHPHIARVYDAGTTPAGRPYFVMELVKGVPLTHYCDNNHATPQERLALFAQVCEAVQHAHQKGIIHRDLKPSNVLVGLHDGKPVPKVIDFGVAKATNQGLTERTVYTEVGSLIGTVVSALSIGVIDQSLQQILLNPVLGKICVLVGIILFLQWRPAGLFVTKSRSLEG